MGVVCPLLLFLLLLWAPPVQSYPDGGRKVCTNHNYCMKKQVVLMGGLIFVKLDFNGTLSEGQGVVVTVSGHRIDGCESVCTSELQPGPKELLAAKDQKSPWIVQDSESPDQKICKQSSTPPLPPPNTGDKANDTHSNATGSIDTQSSNSSQIETSTQSKSRREAPPSAGGTSPQPVVPIHWDAEDSTALYRVEEDGLYIVKVATISELEPIELNSISITLMNPTGYLDAADYPAMVFYSVMLVVYVSLAVVWSVLLCCSYKDLIRLQFFIAVAIFLGVLEKSFFVTEYTVVNVTGESSKSYFHYLVVAEGVSALKKTFARVLLIVVSLGYGTGIPGLGGMLKWVILFGVVYFAAAFTEGVTRAHYLIRDSLPDSVQIAFVPQLVMEVIFVLWVICAIVCTCRALRSHNNTKKKLAFSALVHTLLFTSIGTAAFCVWFSVSGFLNSCEELQSLWVLECFWHVAFTFILIIIMILWRPTNALLSDYLPVPITDEEELEQSVNKNLETMSKRHQTKGNEVVPPKPSHDMDMR